MSNRFFLIIGAFGIGATLATEADVSYAYSSEEVAAGGEALAVDATTSGDYYVEDASPTSAPTFAETTSTTTTTQTSLKPVKPPAIKPTSTRMPLCTDAPQINGATLMTSFSKSKYGYGDMVTDMEPALVDSDVDKRILVFKKMNQPTRVVSLYLVVCLSDGRWQTLPLAVHLNGGNFPGGIPGAFFNGNESSSASSEDCSKENETSTSTTTMNLSTTKPAGRTSRQTRRTPAATTMVETTTGKDLSTSSNTTGKETTTALKPTRRTTTKKASSTTPEPSTSTTKGPKTTTDYDYFVTTQVDNDDYYNDGEEATRSASTQKPSSTTTTENYLSTTTEEWITTTPTEEENGTTEELTTSGPTKPAPTSRRTRSTKPPIRTTTEKSDNLTTPLSVSTARTTRHGRLPLPPVIINRTTKPRPSSGSMRTTTEATVTTTEGEEGNETTPGSEVTARTTRHGRMPPPVIIHRTTKPKPSSGRMRTTTEAMVTTTEGGEEGNETTTESAVSPTRTTRRGRIINRSTKAPSSRTTTMTSQSTTKTTSTSTASSTSRRPSTTDEYYNYSGEVTSQNPATSESTGSGSTSETTTKPEFTTTSGSSYRTRERRTPLWMVPGTTTAVGGPTQTERTIIRNCSGGTRGPQCLPGVDKTHASCLEDSPQLINTVIFDIDEPLNVHNWWRRNVSPPAKDLRDLIWDDDLALTAERYSATCPLTYSQPQTRAMLSYNYGVIQVGQSICWSKSSDMSWTKCINSWGNESKNWRYGDGVIKAGATASHYAQMVWQNTVAIGCGKAQCESDAFAYVLVCNYGPAGDNLSSRTGPNIKMPYICAGDDDEKVA